jgi:hypothetical protein
MNHVSFLEEHERRRQPMLEYSRITFGDPEVRRLQREMVAHRWVTWLLSVVLVAHLVWGHL